MAHSAPNSPSWSAAIAPPSTSTKPVLECIGNNVFYMGELGMGALTKVINNMVGITCSQVLMEATVLARKAGLDPQRAYEVMSVASARTHLRAMPQLLERNYDNPSFFLQWAAKDVSLAVQIAGEEGMAVPLASAAADYLLRAKQPRARPRLRHRHPPSRRTGRRPATKHSSRPSGSLAPPPAETCA